MPLSPPPLETLPDFDFVIGDSARSEDGGNGVFPHVYAATGTPTKNVQLAGPEQIDEAVQAARKAKFEWRWTPGDQRRRCFFRLAQLLREAGERFARMGVVEGGMPIAVTRMALESAADGFEYFGGWTDKVSGDVVQNWPIQTFDYVVREPYGVVAMMLPFNVPMKAASVTVPAALAAGNCVVVKPSSMGPFSLLRLGELALQAGFPPGVLNVVPSDAQGGEALVRTPGVNKVLFMGSGKSAQYVLAAADEHFTPVLTELGGKSATLVFEDADIDESAMLAIGSGLAIIGGQGCALGTRILVQSTIYDEFVKKGIEVAQSLRIGDPFESDTQLGPIVNSAAVDRIQGVVDSAVENKWGRLVTGGHRPGGEFADGAYFEPTLFVDVDNDSPLAAKEIFGPVLCIMPFKDEDEAIRLANHSTYGLAGFVQTNDVKRVHRVAARLECGAVWANGFQDLPVAMPFGGTKESGSGRIGGWEAIREMTRTKNVSVSMTDVFNPRY
jgi:aldehyde dehydrogenase (NAD+)